MSINNGMQGVHPLSSAWIAAFGVVIPMLVLMGTFFAVAMPLLMVRAHFSVTPALMWLCGWLVVALLAWSLIAPGARASRLPLFSMAFASLAFVAAAIAYFTYAGGAMGLNVPALPPLVLCLVAVGAGAAAVGSRLYAGFSQARGSRISSAHSAIELPSAERSRPSAAHSFGVVRPAVGLLVSLLPLVLVMVLVPGGLLFVPAYWLLFGVPMYAVLRAKRWFHAWQAALAGFAVGFLPWVLQGLVTTGADSARIGSCVTALHGITTACGHWLNVKFAIPFGVMGALSALGCWVVDLRVRKGRASEKTGTGSRDRGY